MCVVCVCGEHEWAVTHMEASGSICPHPASAWGSDNQGENFSVILRSWESEESTARKRYKEELQPSEISPGYQNHSFTLCQTRHGIILSVSYPVFNILLSYMHVLKENPHNMILFSLWRKQKRFRNRGRTHCIPEGPIKILQTSFLLLPKSIQFTSLGATCCYLLLQLIYYT